MNGRDKGEGEIEEEWEIMEEGEEGWGRREEKTFKYRE